MIRSFFRHSFLYTFVNFINKGIGILLTPLYTRVFDPKDYGVLDWVLIIASLLIGLLSLQIGQGLGFYFSDTKNELEKKQISSSALLFVLAISCLPLISITAAPEFFAELIVEDASQTRLVKLFAVYILVGGLFFQFDNLLKWMLFARGRFATSIIQSFLTIGLIAYFVLVKDYGVEGVLMGRIIGQTVSSIFAAYLARRYLGLTFHRKSFNSMLAYSYPLVFVSVGSLLMSYVDRIIIKSMIGFDMMGLYGVGFKFASVLRMMFIGIGGALSPLILNNHRKKETPGEIVKIFHVVFAVGLLAIVGISLYSHEILILLTTEKYYAGYIFIPFVSGMFFFDQLYQFAPGLGLAKKTKTLSAIFIGKLILNLALNYIGVIYFGAIGVAVATIFTSLVGLVVVTSLSQREYPIPYRFNNYIIAVLLLSVVVFFGIDLDVGNMLTNIGVKAALVLLAGLVLFVIGIFKPKEQLMQFVKSFGK